MNRKLFVLLPFILLLAAACARASQQSQEVQEVQMALDVEPDPPVVGPATLTVTLTDAEGQPVEGATLSVKGDMSHAGMEPVLAEGSEGPGGVYEVPFEWTMGGDWYVTVQATLPDGTMVTQRFDWSVAGQMDEMEGMDE